MAIVEVHSNSCYTTGIVKQHAENMEMLHTMLCVLRERQSSWKLTAEERQQTKRGIEALEAAKAALSVQIYA